MQDSIAMNVDVDLDIQTLLDEIGADNVADYFGPDELVTYWKAQDLINAVMEDCDMDNFVTHIIAVEREKELIDEIKELFGLKSLLGMLGSTQEIMKAIAEREVERAAEEAAKTFIASMRAAEQTAKDTTFRTDVIAQSAVDSTLNTKGINSTGLDYEEYQIMEFKPDLPKNPNDVIHEE
jgi:hypothetical protein